MGADGNRLLTLANCLWEDIKVEAKQHDHKLPDQLGPGQLAAVVHLLEIMVPPDDDGDTLSNAERQALGEADECLKHDKPIPHEEVLAEFGLTMAEWDKMGKEPQEPDESRRDG